MSPADAQFLMQTLTSHRDAIVGTDAKLVQLIDILGKRLEAQDTKILKLENDICELILLGSKENK